jgi:hypothetical protein
MKKDYTRELLPLKGLPEFLAVLFCGPDAFFRILLDSINKTKTSFLSPDQGT